MAIEIVTFAVFNRYTQRDWDYDAYLTSLDRPIHSLYTQESYTAPHYSWFHGSGTKLHLAQQDPQFARLTFGHPLPQTMLHPAMRCNEIIQSIQSKSLLPEYVMFADYGEEKDGLITLEVCRATILSIRRDGHQLYSLEKVIDGEMEWFNFRTGTPRQREKYLFHLDLDNFTPY